MKKNAIILLCALVIGIVGLTAAVLRVQAKEIDDGLDQEAVLQITWGALKGKYRPGGAPADTTQTNTPPPPPTNSPPPPSK